MFSTLRAKVAAGFTVLVIINVVVSAWSIYNFNQLTRAVSTMAKQNYQNIVATQNMVLTLERDNSAQLEMLNGYVDSGYRKFVSDSSDFFVYYNQALASNLSPRGAEILSKIKGAYAKYSQATAIFKDVLLTSGYETYGRTFHYDRILPLFVDIRDECFRLFDINNIAMSQTVIQAGDISNRATVAVVGAAILAIVLSIIASWQFSQYILEPAEKLTNTVRKIARGYLDVKANIDSKDEIGELANEFNRMTERLRKYEEINIERLILEKRKSEAIVGTISDPIVVADQEGKIVLMNQLAETMFNLSETDAVGQDFQEVVKNSELTKYIIGCLRGGSSLNIPPYFELPFNGENRYFRIRLNSSKDQSGNVTGVILILQDVTQFKELDRLKSEFMARVSHEFRTPLTSINMTLDILKDEHMGHVNRKQHELLSAAKQDAERLTKLVRELLELSRLESGKIQLKEERVNTRSLVEFALQPALLQFSDKGVKLEINVDPSIPDFVADFQQLSWVISNLVTNALRFTDTGGTVSVDATTNGEDLVIAIRDTGCGIEPQELVKIFDKFVQLPDSLTPSPGSVGLGLAIAKEIVEIFGGRIWVDSEVAVGSVFTFSLPIKERSTRMKLMEAHKNADALTEATK